jgi:hypothetical protein
VPEHLEFRHDCALDADVREAMSAKTPADGKAAASSNKTSRGGW